MAHILDSKNISALWEALNAPPRQGDRFSATNLFHRIAAKGWATHADIDDIFYLLDGRLDRRIDTKVLASAFGLPWRWVFDAPKARSSGVTGFQALSAVDTAKLIIQLERLGFDLDATPLAEVLLQQIKQLKQLTDSELSILWYCKSRHKMAPLSVQVDERCAGTRDIKRFKTDKSYKAVLWLDSQGEPLLLCTTPPKYRRRSSPVETHCPKCGFTWYRGDPDSSAIHRGEHKKRMAILEPVILPQFAQACLSEAEPELVTSKSPKWKHKEIYSRAAFFRREFGYDFVQWYSSSGDDDPDVHGFLLADEQGAIVGACAFRLRDRDMGSRWGLQWVWVCPKARRTGVLAKRWVAFRQRFGDFHVEGPVSPAMEAFLAKQGDTVLLGYDPG